MYVTTMDAKTSRTVNIRRLVQEAGGPTAFANTYGAPVDGVGSIWSQAQVSQWISEEKPKSVGHRLAREIERRAKKAPGYLDRLDAVLESAPPDARPRVPVKVYGFTVRGIDDQDGLDPQREVLIKVVDIEVAAGSDGIPIPEFVETRYQLPYQLSWLHDHGAKPEDIMIVPVHGRSMEGVLWSKDVAVVHRRRTKVRDEGVFVFIRPGGASVKRLFNRTDGGLKVVSNNPDKDAYPDEIIPPEDMHKILILGQVIDKHGPGGLGL